jgi:hypothetical protein
MVTIDGDMKMGLSCHRTVAAQIPAAVKVWGCAAVQKGVDKIQETKAVSNSAAAFSFHHILSLRTYSQHLSILSILTSQHRCSTADKVEVDGATRQNATWFTVVSQGEVLAQVR